ncbi:MAG: efflux RND transporter periplasmic adaptor subunit [candidate division WOR-3 bacterium]|nr:efflux RND transporter periplasmic adaptor subunit [candidate division WOR-3 bacterium]
MKKTIGWIIVIAVIGVAVFRIVESIKIRQEKVAKWREKTEEVVAVTTIKPIRGNIKRTISFSGSVKGENQVQVFPDVPGRLLKYTRKEGDKVKKNSEIALVDRSVPGMEYEPSKVRSPVSGTVARLLLDNGQAVSPGVPVAIIVDMSKVKVGISIGEKSLSEIKVGMDAIISIRALGDKKLRGKLDRLSKLVDPTTRSAYGEVLIQSKNSNIIPGSFADVEIIVESSENTLILPREAVIEDIETHKFYAFCVKEGIAEKRELKTGIINGSSVEITSGVDEDCYVITKGREFLKGGEKVKVVK